MFHYVLSLQSAVLPSRKDRPVSHNSQRTGVPPAPPLAGAAVPVDTSQRGSGSTSESDGCWEIGRNDMSAVFITFTLPASRGADVSACGTESLQSLLSFSTYFKLFLLSFVL
jgi:hypothetical protein